MIRESQKGKKNVLRAVEEVAKRLGNTRSVCRKCYIHPAVIDAYMDGSLLKTLAHAGASGDAESAEPETGGGGYFGVFLPEETVAAGCGAITRRKQAI